MLRLNDIENLLFRGEKISLDPADRKNIESCYEFLSSFVRDKVIYGINTGFGPMAQYRISDENLLQLQYNIIRSHSSGAGEPLLPVWVKAAMIARMETFVRGRSGVHVQAVELLAEFINRDIIPVVPRHGSVGASGDLVQLAHIALALIGEGEVFYRGERRAAAEVLKENGLEPLAMHVREGLAITNGTSVMTGIGLVTLIRARRLLVWAVRTSVMINEIVASYDDFMCKELNALKPHPGQQWVARAMRTVAAGSRRLRCRESEFYERKHTEKIFGSKVQPYYSLRCVPQILGPVADELDNAERVLVGELNAVDDNPIVDPETKNVYHGGNFHGDYVSFEMDKLKIAVTKLTMLAERQMNYLFHDRINGILPPFVNLGTLGLNYGLQAAQFTATSTTAECQTLSNPMCVHSIPNNNDNQDVVSMGTNSALLAAAVVENAFQVMSIHAIALVQAADCLKVAEELSPASQTFYRKIREIVPAFVEDTTKYNEIAAVGRFLEETDPDRDW